MHLKTKIVSRGKPQEGVYYSLLWFSICLIIKILNLKAVDDLKNIVLIGMPGCGKSTVGVVLAKALGYRFLDSDLVIQEEDGRLLSEIIDEEGLDGFNRIENRINSGINVRKTVIATGGSVIYGSEAMHHLKKTGIVVYISLPYEEIEKRLGDLHNRGVSIKSGQTLRDLYDERIPLYESYADIIVNEHGMTISETALYIKDMILGSDKI